MKMNKKADMTMAFVIVMILMLVIIAALLYPEYNLFTKISEKTPYDICRNSVEASALLRVRNIELAPYLKCQTQQHTITSNDAEAAKHTVADAMYNCYYQFARGEKNLFSDEGTFCFICSTIDFESKAKDLKELPAFTKYLFENYGDAKNSYAQYFYKSDFNKVKESVKASKLYLAPVKADKLGVLFVYRKFKSGREVAIEQGLYSIAQTLWPSALPPVQMSALGIAGSTYLFGQTIGDYTYGGDVVLVNPYSAENLNALGCTAKISQKTA